MKYRKTKRLVAFILFLVFFCATIANASGNMVELSQKEISSQNISSDSVSAQAKTVGKSYTVWFLFAVVRSEATPFSDSAGILFMREKVTVLSNSGFYSYVKTEDGTTGYVFSGFLSSGMFSESNLISGEYFDVYKDATRENLITAVNGNDSVIWTVSPSGIIEFDKETGTVTGLKYGTATITASSGFTTDSCTVHCIYNWEKNWVGKANTATSVKTGPGDDYENVITMKKGHKFTVSGDGGTSDNGADSWAYGKYTLNGNEYRGYVKINDISTKGTVSQYNNMGWRWPIKDISYNYIRSPYGKRDTEPTKHKGFDISTNWDEEQESISGQTIVSAFAGTVDYICNNPSLSWGYCVSVISDEKIIDPVSKKQFVAIYMHMKSEPKVSRGQEILKEKELGYVGTTGNSTGAHLHFEVNNKTASIYENNGKEASQDGRKSYNDLINPIFFFINYNLVLNEDAEAERYYGAYWYGSE